MYRISSGQQTNPMDEARSPCAAHVRVPALPPAGARLVAAARTKRDAGALDEALGMLVMVEVGSLDALADAEVERLRGQIASDQRRDIDAARLLLRAARRFEPADRGLGMMVNFTDIMSATLRNGLGQHEAARDAAWRAFEHDHCGFGSLVVPELAEPRPGPVIPR